MGAGAGIARQIGERGHVQRQAIGAVGHAGVRRQSRRPGNAAIATRQIRQGAVFHGHTGGCEVADRFGESESDGRGVADFQRGIGNGDAGCQIRPHAIDRVIRRGIGTGTGVACIVGNAGVVDGDDIGAVGDAGVWRQRRGPGGAAIAAGQVRQDAVFHSQIGHRKAIDDFIEGEGDGSGFSYGQIGIGDAHAGYQRRALGIDRVIARVLRAGPGIAVQVGDAGHVQRQDIAGIFNIRARR